MATREKKSGGSKKVGGSRNRPVNLESPPPAPSAAPASFAVSPFGVPPPLAHQAAAPPAWSSANPWGSYFNLLQQPLCASMQSNGENAHLVGVAKSMSPPSPATTPTATYVAKKRFWSHDEEVRLASAWLNTSKDPIHGNDKNRDSFWSQITEKFNKDSQPDRIRDTNQLKCHWSRLSATINEFNGFWSTVCKMHKSGYSDDQLMDEAQKRFTNRNKKPFAHVHWWRILKNEPKWCTSVAQAEKDKSKAIEIDDKEERPIGREAAKAERKGKRKAEELMDGIIILGDNVNKVVEVVAERKKELEKATDAQLEISRINLKVVKEQKEVKLLQAYNSLLIDVYVN